MDREEEARQEEKDEPEVSYRRTLGTWTDDAERAVVANPRYFMWWYTAKSLSVVAAVAVAAYYVGKNRGRGD